MNQDEAERITEVKETLARIINANPELGHAYPFELEGDVLYEGPLVPLLEFFQEWRSEIEELQ